MKLYSVDNLNGTVAYVLAPSKKAARLKAKEIPDEAGWGKCEIEELDMTKSQTLGISEY